MTTSQTERGQRALDRALELVIVVRDYGRDGITRWLRSRSRHELEAITVALAALVPEDRSAADLLAWMQEPPKARQTVLRIPAPKPAPRQLQPCGTRSAYERHKKRGEQPCQPCDEAQREYHSARYGVSRRAQDARAAGRARRAC